MKKFLFGLMAGSALISAAEAQTFSNSTKWNGNIGVRTAQHTSSTTGTYDTVADTRGNASFVISSSVAGVTATLTLATDGGAVVSTSALTLYTTPTVINVTGPLNFQKAKLTMNAGGAATISDTRIFTRQ